MSELYSENWLLESSVKALKSFESCKEIQCTSNSAQRKGLDIQFWKLFCNDTQCCQTFYSVEELGDHMAQDVHSNINVKSSIGKVKQSFGS